MEESKQNLGSSTELLNCPECEESFNIDVDFNKFTFSPAGEYQKLTKKKPKYSNKEGSVEVIECPECGNKHNLEYERS